MSTHTNKPKEFEPWLINLRALVTRSGLSPKQIAEKENMAERTVSRILAGETSSPGVEPVRKIVHACGGSWSEIFAESGAVIGGQDLVAMQAEIDRLREEVDRLTSSLNIATLDLAVQKDKVSALEAENKLLCLKLEYEEKLNAVHSFYNKLNPSN